MEEIPSDAEQRYKKIHRLWRANNAKVIVPFALAIIGLLIATAPLAAQFGGGAQNLVLAFILIVYIVGLSLLVGVSMKRTVAKLTGEDYETLSIVAQDSKDRLQRYGAKRLLETSAKIFPQKEYLRASSPTQENDTLLRAATQTDDTPQEELLRAAPNQEAN